MVINAFRIHGEANITQTNKIQAYTSSYSNLVNLCKL